MSSRDVKGRGITPREGPGETPAGNALGLELVSTNPNTNYVLETVILKWAHTVFGSLREEELPARDDQ